jgi:iron complex outermembrane receptor protein
MKTPFLRLAAARFCARMVPAAFRLAAFTTFLVAISPSTILADSLAPATPGPTQLATIDVIGSRTASDISRLPEGSVVIEHAQIERLPASSLADVLRSIGGITLSSYYGSGNYSTPDLMGFGATANQNTLILLNGRRLNTVDLSSVNLDSIPLSAIERIEVLPGSGSVLYGSGAVGGVINIVTRTHYNNAGQIEATAGEQNTRGGAVQGSFSHGQSDGMLSASRLGTDGYRDNNASWQTHVFGDLRHTANKATFYLTSLYNKEHIDLPGSLNTAQVQQKPWGTTTPDDWAQDESLNLMPGMRYRFNDDITLHLDTGFRVRTQKSDYVSLSSSTETTDRTLSLSPRLTGQTTLGVMHHWTLGTDYFSTHYNADSNFYGQEHYRRATQALYAQDSLTLTSSTWLTLGARHEWLHTSKETSTTPDDDDEVGMWSLGIRQALSNSFALFAKAERSARYATVDDLRTGPLRTQTGTLYSLGGDWHEGGQYSTLTLWQGKYHNEIAYDPTIYQNVNLDPTKRSGVSLNSYWKLDRNLWLAIAGSYQTAHFDAGPHADHNVPLVPRLSGYARVDWQALPRLALSLSERYQGKQYYDGDFDNTFGKQIPSYHWMDISATWRPANGKSIYLKAILHNVENKQGAYDYAGEYGTDIYAYPLPGRYLIAKIGVDF